MNLTVYLAGEIHSSWRRDIEALVDKRNVPVRLMGPEPDHATSDDIGERILGAEESTFWRDHKAAKINTIRKELLPKLQGLFKKRIEIVSREKLSEANKARSCFFWPCSSLHALTSGSSRTRTSSSANARSLAWI